MKALEYYRIIEEDKNLTIGQRFFIQYWLRNIDRKISSYERINLVGINFLLMELVEGLYEYQKDNLSKYDIFDIYNEIVYELEDDYVISTIKLKDFNKKKRKIIDTEDPFEVVDELSYVRTYLFENYRKIIWEEFNKLFKLEEFHIEEFKLITRLCDSLIKEIIFLDYPLEHIKASFNILLFKEVSFDERFKNFYRLIERPSLREFEMIFKVTSRIKKYKVETHDVEIFREKIDWFKSPSIKNFLALENGEIFLKVTTTDRTAIGAAMKGYEKVQSYLDIIGVSHLETTDIDPNCMMMFSERNFKIMHTRRMHLASPMSKSLVPKLLKLSNNDYFDRLSLEKMKTFLRNYRIASVIDYPMWIRYLLLWQCLEALGRTEGIRQNARQLISNITNIYTSHYFHMRYQRLKTNLFILKDDNSLLSDLYKEIDETPYSLIMKVTKDPSFFQNKLKEYKYYEIFIIDIVEFSIIFSETDQLYQRLEKERKKLYWSLRRSMRVRNLHMHKSHIFLSPNQIQFFITDLYGAIESLVRLSYQMYIRKEDYEFESIIRRLLLISDSYLEKVENNEITPEEVLFPLHQLI